MLNGKIRLVLSLAGGFALASNMHQVGVARWYDNLMHDQAHDIAPEHSHLLGEASHAAGNLIHRMYYLTAVLEDDPQGEEAVSAIEQLKVSLGGLHRLVNRTMALIRPVDVQPVAIAAGDLVRSVALRCGVTLSEATLVKLDAELAKRDVDADPGQLDRALGMLAESIGVTAASDSNGEKHSATLKVTVTDAIEDSNNCDDQIVFDIRVERNRTPPSLPTDSVSQAISVALATRVLGLLRWRIEVDEDGHSSRLTIFVPFSTTCARPVTPRVVAPL